MIRMLTRLAKIPLIYFFIIPVFLGFFLLPLMQRGMFVDGLFYSIISRNWAEGIGDTWHLYGAELQSFEGHPPLFFVLEGTLFWLFGDHFWVEGLFMILVLMGIVVLFWFITRTLQDTLLIPSPSFLRWLFPYTLFLFLCMNGVAHIFNINLLDTLLTFFTLWSVYFSLRAYQKSSLAYLYYGLAGVTIFLGYLSKGPVALYPLAVPSLLYFFFKDTQRWKGLLWSIYMLGIVVSCMVFLFLTTPEAFYAMKRYHEIQIVPALKSNVSEEVIGQGGRQVNAYSWQQRLFVFFTNLFYSLLGSLLVFTCMVVIYVRFILKKKRIGRGIYEKISYRKTLYFWGVLSLCASLPIMLSPTIFVWYLLPSATIFALFFAYVLTPFLTDLSFYKPMLTRGILLVLSVGILSVSIYRFGMTSRDAEAISLADMIKKHTTPHSHIFTDSLTPATIGLCIWELNAYTARYAHTYLRDIRDVGYETPSFLLLHQKALFHYRELMSVYQEVDHCNNFVLYQYVGGGE